MFSALLDYGTRLGLVLTLGLIAHRLATAQSLPDESIAVDSLTIPPPTHQQPTHQQVVLMQNDRLVAVYHESVVADPGSESEENAKWYDQSGFVHPFRSPSGRIVTAAFPTDHRHQHAITPSIGPGFDSSPLTDNPTSNCSTRSVTSLLRLTKLRPGLTPKVTYFVAERREPSGIAASNPTHRTACAIPLNFQVQQLAKLGGIGLTPSSRKFGNTTASVASFSSNSLTPRSS